MVVGLYLANREDADSRTKAIRGVILTHWGDPLDLLRCSGSLMMFLLLKRVCAELI